MADTSSIKQLLEAGAHFGHQASGWHPRMKRYIFTKRNGIHIIDLEQTVKLLAKAQEFIKQTVADGGTPDLTIKVTHAEGEKCTRCWHWETDVGSNPEHPTICARCVEAVKQFKV